MMPSATRHRLATLAPVLVWLTLFFLVPMAAVLVYSFAIRTTGGGVVFGVSIENYVRIVLIRSVRADDDTLAAHRGHRHGCHVACRLSRRLLPRFGGDALRVTLFVLLIVPWWCSILVKNFAWVAILADNGVLNRLLLRAGLIARADKAVLYNDPLW